MTSYCGVKGTFEIDQGHCFLTTRLMGRQEISPHTALTYLEREPRTGLGQAAWEALRAAMVAAYELERGMAA